MVASLTRRQQAVYDCLQQHSETGQAPPTLDELCAAMGVGSRGSLHKHVQALIEAGLVEPMLGKKRGVRLTPQAGRAESGIPFLGYIAGGRPIEAIALPEFVEIPERLQGKGRCYVLEVRGDSMAEAGIIDGDWVVIEERNTAPNGAIVVALIDGEEATLKKLEQTPDRVVLFPANSDFEPMAFAPDRIQIQGIVVGQMRAYR